MRAAAAVAVAAGVLCLAAGRLSTAAQTVDADGEAEADAEAEMVWLEPPTLLKVIEGTSHEVHWFTLMPDVASVTAQMQDQDVAVVDAVGPVTRGSPSDNFTFSGAINVSALFIGYNKLTVALYGHNDVAVMAEMRMSVLLSYQQLSDIFMLMLSVIVALLYVIMGATLDLEVIKMIIKKPLGPLVGIVCQYLFMPLIAFGLAKIAFPDNPLGQLGLFLSGSCPGGGASNMWTHLLGGSLDLSIMMTFISTVTAFAAVPLWVLLMGPTIVGDTHFVIPYKDIAVLVFGLSIPCAVGILIGKFLPKVSAVLGKLLTPFTLFSVMFVFTFGVYANLYVFQLFETKSLLAGFGLPTLGYLSGIGLAWLLGLPMKDRIAIGIETGIQNMSIAIIILKLTLDRPAGDLTVVFPAAAVIMTPVPLIVLLIIRHLYLWRRGPQEVKEEKEAVKEATGKVKTGGEEPEAGGGKVERNGTAAPVEGGIDNPAVEVD